MHERIPDRLRNIPVRPLFASDRPLPRQPDGLPAVRPPDSEARRPDGLHSGGRKGPRESWSYVEAAGPGRGVRSKATITNRNLGLT
jgi:hypothetical protein